jgi:hypothetical protein
VKPWFPVVLCFLAVPAIADEGMWPFNQFPRDAVLGKYKLDVSNGLLDRLRQASVRIGGGSGSLVSPSGLVLTNQHLISGCLARLSTPGRDYLKDGFYAREQSAEPRCGELEAAVLESIDDVTAQVKGVAPEATPAAQAVEQRKTAIARIEKECAARGGARCTVVPLFSGGRYDLYRYRVWNDVRLVFAPEHDLAFFGKERDAVTYLRYGLDAAFLRVYENGKPADTPHYLKWSREPVHDGDLVLAVGNPSPTARLATAAQLTFYRDTALPLAVARLGMRVRELTAFAAKSEANRHAAEPVLNSLLNAYKVAAGKLIGLKDDRLVGRKTFFETRIRRAVERDPKLGAEAGKVWDEVAKAYKQWAPLEKPYQLLEAAPAPGSTLVRMARQIVRGEAVDAAGAIDDSLETLLLGQYLEELKQLPEKEAPLKSILGGKTPRQAAEAMVQATKLKDPAARRRGADDAMLRLAQVLDEPARKIGRKHQDVIESLEASAAERIAQYRFRLFGAAEYPDATGTPRVEFGVVKGYTDRAGVAMPYAATFSGLYYRRNNAGPYQVPQPWVDLQAALDPVARLDFVSTCDIGGGDSGSPTVNRAGEMVGVIFDGNLESLPGVYLYSDEQARAVHVAVEGIAEALAKIYKAQPLLEELGAAARPEAATLGPSRP